MAITDKNTIKEWFKTFAIPTQEQFWAFIDSYRHKGEKIPLADIDGIDNVLANKANKNVVDTNTTQIALKQNKSEKGQADGFAPLDENIKIPSQYLQIIDDLVTGGSSSIASAETVKQLKQQLDDIPLDSTSVGAITPDKTIPPTINVHGFAAEAGTYANCGDVVVPANSLAIISRVDGVWSVSSTVFDLSEYSKKSDVNYPDWENKDYLEGKKINFLGTYWKANEDIVIGEVPSISPKWILDNQYTRKKVIANFYDKNTITVGFYPLNNGNLFADANYNTSDFIEVKPSTSYYGNVGIRFKTLYNLNKEPILADYNTTNGTTFTTSINARYVRLGLTVVNSQNLDLREGASTGIFSPVTYENTIPYNELNVDAVLINPNVNLFNNTEDLSKSYFSTTNATKGTDTINYKGIALTKLSGNSFYGLLETRLNILATPLFVVGEKYLLSYYILNIGSKERFIWMRPLANTSSNGHEPKIIDGKVRRVWTIGQAISATGLRLLSNPVLDWDSQTGAAPVWFFSGNGFISPDTQAFDVRIGGFQIEKIDDPDYVNGIALIGDSTMQGGAANYDRSDSKEVSTYIAGLLNVPVFNRAVGGERTDQMDARWGTDITPLAKNCKYSIIQGAINDIGNDRPLDDIKVSIESMYNKAIVDNMTPILMTCTPATSIAEVPAREADRLALNLWLKTTFPLVLDIASIVADPTNPSVLNPIWAGDGIHYTFAAKRAIANAVAKWEFWDFITPKPYQQILSDWNTTKQKPFDRKIGEIKVIQGIDIFAEDNNVSVSSRGFLH